MTPENQMFWGQAVMALNPQVTYMTDWVNAWDAENNPVEYDHAEADVKANELMDASIQGENKQQAIAKLQATDWAATVDITDPAYSDPCLGNQPDFLRYRSTLRKIAVNPPTTPVTEWPTEPDAVWEPAQVVL